LQTQGCIRPLPRHLADRDRSKLLAQIVEELATRGGVALGKKRG
jgi:hypothetical protein